MSICIGVTKILGYRQILCMLILLGLSLACGGTIPMYWEDIPIVVSEVNSQAIDIDIVIINARKEVEKVLPNSNLTFFSLVAECDALSELQGDVHMHFSQTRSTFLSKRILTARVVVDTIQQDLRMTVEDETEHYPSADLLEMTGISVVEIANALEAYLDSMDKCDDTIVLSRSTPGDPWGVRCGPPDKAFIRCLEINPITGDITEVGY